MTITEGIVIGVLITNLLLIFLSSMFILYMNSSISKELNMLEARIEKLKQFYDLTASISDIVNQKSSNRMYRTLDGKYTADTFEGLMEKIRNNKRESSDELFLLDDLESQEEAEEKLRGFFDKWVEDRGGDNLDLTSLFDDEEDDEWKKKR